MKKIIIVNNNMKVGGVQKSLYNLLWEIRDQYDVTLFLFQPVGAYMDKLPPSVKVVPCRGPMSLLGISQGECRGFRAIARGALAALCKVFGRPAVMKLMLPRQRAPEERYDCAISFLHGGNRKSFYGGTQEFVLRKIKANRRVAFLHCDYGSCGANFKENNRDMAKFDRIAACSEGCGEAFRRVLPELGEKCVTVRNCHRYEEIQALAGQEPVCYDSARHNVVMVARLAHEKGIERAVEAAAFANRQGLPVTLHLVGGGPMEDSLRRKAGELGIGEFVRFYGEQENPYRYMAKADLLLLSSYHEAAPMVIEEARCLGLPVLTVKTTSSQEMVAGESCGWVCNNDLQVLKEELCRVLRDRETLEAMRDDLKNRKNDNTRAAAQFAALIGE